MLKFIRKYNKILLVGFGVFLMISFLAPAGISHCTGDPRDRVVATIAGRPVTARMLALSAAERDAARDFLLRTSLTDQGGLMQRMVESGGYLDLLLTQADYNAIIDRIRNGTLPIDQYTLALAARLVENFIGVDGEHWFLLTEQAKMLGFVGGAEDGRDWLNSLSGGSADLQALLASLRANAARRGGMTLEQADEMLSKIQGVARVYTLYARSAPASDRAVLVTAKQALDQVGFDYVLVRGSDVGAALEAPDEAALLAHFERFREERPHENTYGIGYVRPARAKVEWIKIDRQVLSDMVFISPVLIREEYDQRTALYPGTEQEGLAAAAAALRERTTDVLMREAERVVRGAVQPLIDRLPSEGAYRVVPEDWTRPSFEELAGRIDRALRSEGDKPSPRWRLRKERPGEGPAPIVTVERREASWLTAQELGRLDGVGGSAMRVGGRMVPFSQAVMAAKELQTTDQPRPDREDLAIQIGVPVVDRPARDGQGNEYFFTVLDARKESPAESVEEVRATIESDWRSFTAFEQLREELDHARALAVSDGLHAVASLYGTTVGDVTIPLPVRESTAQRGSVGVGELNTREFLEALFEAADLLDPLVLLDEIDADRLVLVQALPKSRSIAAVRITRLLPATIERFRTVGGFQADRLERAAVARGGDVFSPRKLRERLEFKPRTERGERDEAS